MSNTYKFKWGRALLEERPDGDIATLFFSVTSKTGWVLDGYLCTNTINADLYDNKVCYNVQFLTGENQAIPAKAQSIIKCNVDRFIRQSTWKMLRACSIC